MSSKEHAVPESNTEWHAWGQADPFWGVASWQGRERGGENPWTPNEFYQLGASDWSDFLEHWKRYGVTPGTCLEIGSGAGRLTKSIAADFDHVIGVDVSEGMVETARRFVTEENVRFALSTGVDLPALPGSVDGVFSTHVFQHFDSLEVASANFEGIARVLAPGGTLMLHMPIFVAPEGIPFVERAVQLRARIADAQAARGRRRGAPVMKYLRFSWPWLRKTLTDLGFVDVELVVFAVRSNGSDHPFVLARKP